MIRPTFESYPNVIFIKDNKFRFVYANQAFIDIAKLGGVTDIIGSISEDFRSSDHDGLSGSTDAQVLKEGKTIEYLDKFNGATQVYYAIIKSPIYNQQGEIIGILGQSRDASELIEAHDLIEKILNTIPYPVFIKNLDLKYIRINDAYAAELRKAKNEIIGKSDLDLFGPKYNKFYRSKDRQVIESGEGIMYISSSVYDENQFMTIKEPLHDHHGEIIGVVGIVNPYLDMAEVQNELIKQQKIESLSVLAGGIAHDLNNMLTSIMGLSSILLEDIKMDKHKKMVETIYTSSLNAANLIEKLLTFSKQTPNTFDQIDFIKLITQVTDLISSSNSTNLSINTDLCCQSLPIYADKTQLSQMFMNFIINAAEAMQFNGKIMINVRLNHLNPIHSDYIIMSNTAKPGDYVCVNIIDNGPGIDKNNLTRIFDPYFSTKEKGSGLGLSIVYGVLMAHHGLLKVDTSDLGTKFEVCLPLIQDQM